MRNTEEAKWKKKYEDGWSLYIKSLKALANSSYSLLSFALLFNSFIFSLKIHKHHR